MKRGCFVFLFLFDYAELVVVEQLFDDEVSLPHLYGLHLLSFYLQLLAKFGECFSKAVLAVRKTKFPISELQALRELFHP